MKPSISSTRRVAGALLLLSLSAAAGLASPGPVTRAAGLHASLSSLLLSSSDVQHNFGNGFKTASYPTTQVNGNTLSFTPGGAFKAGFVGGYTRSFTKNLSALLSGTGTPKGVYSVISVVSRYKSSSYAHAAVKAALKEKLPTSKGVSYRITKTSGVGRIAVFATIHDSLGFATDTVEVGFERGVYVAAVIVVVYGGAKPSLATITTLARVVDARIKAHG